MTASMVTRVNAFNPITSKQSAGESAQTDAFSKVFEQNQTVLQETKESGTVAKDFEKTKEPVADDVQKAQTEDTSVKTEENPKGELKEVEKDSEDIADTKETSEDETDSIGQLLAAQEAARKMQEAVLNVLQITPQQLEQVMEELGMTPADLFDGVNIQKLVVALTEGADEFSMMTDANLFADVKELMGIANELTDEFANQVGMAEEDAQNYLQNLTALVDEAEMPQVVVEDEGIVQINEDETVLQNFNEESVEEVQVKETAVAENETQKKETSAKQGDDSNGQNFTQTVMDNLKDAVYNTKEAQTVSYTTNVDNIMEQITEAVKLTMNQEMTEMELQLHPASLGNVRVQVAAKEGVITATFTTQNEMVKSALESQMIVLKENFESQGIKVEAVEVTVASHAFEQNLNGNANNRTGEEAQAKKKTARRINLSELTDETVESDLEESDKIVADMMKKNGNTVDYTA